MRRLGWSGGRIWVPAVTAVAVALLVPRAGRAQEPSQTQAPAQEPLSTQSEKDKSYEARKKQAIEMFQRHRMTDAMTVFEDLHAEKPGDAAVLGLLSFTVLANSATLKDPQARQKERVRARKLAGEALAAGDKSNLTKVVLEVPEDGSEVALSARGEVQSAMEEGEAAFVKGDFDAALTAYDKALALDPRLYEAALYSGDVYFKRDDHDAAARWFGRAIEIDPNRETAYRYWGDDLVAQGKMGQAKTKFIEAVVAEPYAPRSWVGLEQWGRRQKLALQHPRIEPPGKIEDKAGQTNITLDLSTVDKKAQKNGTNAWFMYTMMRATWHGDRFKKEFPEEKEYRHSLREEMDGLQIVVNQVKEGLEKKQIKQLDPTLALLLKLSDQGLLEAFVLISRADAGLAKDYPAYRDAHRDKIRLYISEWIIQQPK